MVTAQPKPISEEELKEMEDIGLGAEIEGVNVPRLIAEVRRLRDALVKVSDTAAEAEYDYDSAQAANVHYCGQVAREALGWPERGRPCDNPSCDGVKDDKNYGDTHRCFKDGRWLDDGSEM